MLTTADITKLKGVFATKDYLRKELKKYPTKDDLRKELTRYPTKDDLRKELKRYPTKDDLRKELKKYATKDDLKEMSADLRVEINEVRDMVETTASAVIRIENTLDKVAGAINDLRTENGAGYVHLVRHDRQIAVLAKTVGVVLPD